MPLVLLVVLLCALLGGVVGACAPQTLARDESVASAPAAAPDAAVATDDGAVRATEHPFLWRIELDPPSYLYGTMHLGDPRLLALPEAVTQAFDASDALYVEIPFDLATMARASAGSFLPFGTTLADVLPAETTARLRAFLDARGLPFEAVQQLRPWALAAALPMLVDPPPPDAGAPLDLTLWGLAGEQGKDRGALETVDEQLAIFENTSPEAQARQIESVLDQLETDDADGLSPNERLLRDYLTGDDSALLAWSDVEDELGVDDDAEGRRFARSLVVDRNVRMLDGVLDLLDEHPEKSLFIAVGALHQVGPYGLAALLRDEGFEVTRLGAPEAAATP